MVQAQKGMNDKLIVSKPKDTLIWRRPKKVSLIKFIFKELDPSKNLGSVQEEHRKQRL